MKIIYLHEESGKTFKTKQGYENFDKKYQLEKTNKLKIKYNTDNYRNFPRLNATSFSEYVKLCIEYINKINEGIGITYSGLKFHSLYYSENLSNSHSSPIGMPTNWSGKAELPTGYPGWRGRVTFKKEYVLSKKKYMSSSDYSEINDIYKGILGLNTGTGGGGYEECSYDVSLFIDDFPLIKEKYNRLSYLKEKKEAHTSEVNKKIYDAIENDSLDERMRNRRHNLEKYISELNNKRYQVDEVRRLINIHYHEKLNEENPFPEQNELDSIDIL